VLDTRSRQVTTIAGLVTLVLGAFLAFRRRRIPWVVRHAMRRRRRPVVGSILMATGAWLLWRALRDGRTRT
jgi:LPXTG-motif cell wall-anchored protein